MTIQTFKRGHVVMAQGDPSDNKLYVILEGSAAVVVNFKGTKPPSEAIYNHSSALEQPPKDIELNEQEESITSKFLAMLVRNTESLKKSYIPLGESQEMRDQFDINNKLRTEIENNKSILCGKNISLKKTKSNQPSLGMRLLKMIQENKSKFMEDRQLKEIIFQSQQTIEEQTEEIPSLLTNLKDRLICLCQEESLQNSKKTNKELEQAYLKQIQSFGNQVNEVIKGQGFGDKALLATNPKLALRNATIISTSPLLCIVILRKDFLRVMENFSKEAILKEKVITKELKFFTTVSSTSLKERLLYFFKDISLLKNEFICQEGEEGQGLFILQAGSVVVSKIAQIPNQNKKPASVGICLIERPTLFCEETVLSNETNPRCNYTIKVVSHQAHLYFCPRHIFTQKFPKEAFEELFKLNRSREVLYSNLFKNNTKALNNNDVFLNKIDYAQLEEAKTYSFQQNKELYVKMKCSLTGSPRRNQMDQSPSEVGLTVGQKIILDDTTLMSTASDFETQLDTNIKKKLEEKELIKLIFHQKKLKIDKRKQLFQKNGFSKSLERNTSLLPSNPNQGKQTEQEFDSQHQNLSSIEQRQLKFLRKYSEKGILGQRTNEDLNLAYLYDNQEEIFSDPDVSSLLKISKPKEKQASDLLKSSFNLSKSSSVNELKHIKVERQDINKQQEFCQDDLDIGYIEDFKRQQYYLKVRKGAIKIPFHSSSPKVDIKKQVMKKIGRQVDNQKGDNHPSEGSFVVDEQFLNFTQAFERIRESNNQTNRLLGESKHDSSRIDLDNQIKLESSTKIEHKSQEYSNNKRNNSHDFTDFSHLGIRQEELIVSSNQHIKTLNKCSSEQIIPLSTSFIHSQISPPLSQRMKENPFVTNQFPRFSKQFQLHQQIPQFPSRSLRFSTTRLRPIQQTQKPDREGQHYSSFNRDDQMKQSQLEIDQQNQSQIQFNAKNSRSNFLKQVFDQKREIKKGNNFYGTINSITQRDISQQQISSVSNFFHLQGNQSRASISKYGFSSQQTASTSSIIQQNTSSTSFTASPVFRNNKISQNCRSEFYQDGTQ